MWLLYSRLFLERSKMKKFEIFLILCSCIFASSSLLCMQKTVEIQIEEKKKTVVKKIVFKKKIRKKLKVGTLNYKVQKIRDALELGNNEPLKAQIKEWAKNKQALQYKEKEIASLEKSRNKWCYGTSIACCILPMFYCGIPFVKKLVLYMTVSNTDYIV